jgi:cell division protein FtsA
MAVHHKTGTVVLGLDIGSSQISACVCEINPMGEIQVRGYGLSPTQGLQKGRILNPDELQRSIEKAIQRAELAAGIRADQVISNLPLHNTSFIHNIGLVISKEPSGKISEAEKVDCLKRSKNIVKDPLQTVVHMIPLYFKVDEVMVQNPVGVLGSHLEAKTHIVLVDSDILHHTTLLLKKLRLKITGIVYDGLASAQTLLTEKEIKNGSIVIDMGGRFTKISVFKNGLLQRASLVPIGGDTLTSDISQCLKINIPEAERLKILYGHANSAMINPGEYIEANSGRQGGVPIQRKLLCQIIQARLEEWLRLIQAEMSFDFDPHYHITLGGKASQLAGLAPMIESALNRRTSAELTQTLKRIFECPDYASALGLVIYGLKSKAIVLVPPVHQDPFQRLNNWVKEFF